VGRRISTAGLLCAIAATLSCAHYEIVNLPPDIVLTQFPAVGIITFSSTTAHPDVARYATERFLQQLTEAQPGIRVLELGTVEEVLAKVGKSRLDTDAIRAVGASANIQALFAGSVDVTAPRSSFNLSLSSVGVRTDVTGQLTATLYDTAQGAVVWTRTVRNGDTSGGGGISAGSIEVAVGGEDNAYARIFRRASFTITDAFRPHEVTRRIQ
jgi:hypothetical protein